MKKQIIVLGITSVLASGLLVGCFGGGPDSPRGCKGERGGKYCENKGGKKGKHCGSKGHHKGKHNKHMKMLPFYELDLTTDQLDKLRELKKESHKGKKQNRGNHKEHLKASFDGEKFNKAKFIAAGKKNHSDRVEKKAEMFEKMYNILTPKQKKEFLKLLSEK